MDGVIVAGLPLPNWTPSAEGVRFEPTFGGRHPFVFLAYDRPTPAEEQRFAAAKMWLGLYKASVHTAVLVLGIPGMLAPEGFGDAPFSACLNPEQKMPESEPNAGIVFTFVLADNNTGVVHGTLRTATISPEFTRLLYETHAEQRAHSGTFTLEKHHAEVAETYRRFPTPKAMLRDCLIVEPMGVPFAEAREKRFGTLFRGQAGS